MVFKDVVQVTIFNRVFLVIITPVRVCPDRRSNRLGRDRLSSTIMTTGRLSRPRLRRQKCENHHHDGLTPTKQFALFGLALEMIL